MALVILPRLTNTQVECDVCNQMVEPTACTYRHIAQTVVYTCILCQVKNIPTTEKEVHNITK